MEIFCRGERVTMTNQAEQIIRSLVRVFPRANLTLDQVFALDEAKDYITMLDSVEGSIESLVRSGGDGHR